MSGYGNMGAPVVFRSAPVPGIRVGWVRVRARETREDGSVVERVEHYGGPCQGDPTFAGVEILKSDGIPPGTAIAVCRPSAEHRRAMEGMTAEERGRYMAALRLAVVVRDVGGQP